MNSKIHCSDCWGLVNRIILFAIVVLNSSSHAEAQEHKITLGGVANGGILSLTKVSYRSASFVSIQTTQGESANSVLKRLATEINKSDLLAPSGWFNGSSGIRIVAEARGDALVMPGFYRYAFTGTDTGFVIPKPILSFSGSYDSDKNQVVFHWLNPGEHNNEIHLSGSTLPADATSFISDWKGAKTRSSDDDFFPYWLGIVFERGKTELGVTVSPPAGIDLKINSQEELDAFPFYMGVAPNWCGWSDSSNAGAVKLEQGNKPGVLPKGYIRNPDQKPVYQIIKTTQSGVQGGVWRRFLGLKPGNTYQVEVRLNTLEMDACTNAWSFSFHAACDNPDGSGLTEAQMAGQAALPDGNKGPEAGRVALYEPGVTTKGQWMKRSTDTPGSGLEIKNITLPKDVTSITVWLRHSGANSTGVGMDWIKLTDVTDKH